MKIEDDPDLRQFLENGLRMIYTYNAKRVAIFATLEDDDILFGYHECNIPTKLLYAGYIQQDAMIDTLNRRAEDEENSEDDETT